MKREHYSPFPEESESHANELREKHRQRFRQHRDRQEMRKMEKRVLAPDTDYDKIEGLRNEAREKLKEIRPINLAQASRISGVNPADIIVLMIYLENGKPKNCDKQ